MEWSDIAYTVGGMLVVALSGTGIKLLMSYIKNIHFVKALNVEKLLDTVAETAVHYAEAWGRSLEGKGSKKLAVAKEKFEAILQTHKVSIPPDLVEKRLEAVLNKLKPSVENKSFELRESGTTDDTAILPKENGGQ